MGTHSYRIVRHTHATLATGRSRSRRQPYLVPIGPRGSSGQGIGRLPATGSTLKQLHETGQLLCSERLRLLRASSAPAALPPITTARQLALVPPSRSKMRLARAGHWLVTGAWHGQRVSSAARVAAAEACGGSVLRRGPTEDHRRPAPAGGSATTAASREGALAPLPATTKKIGVGAQI